MKELKDKQYDLNIQLEEHTKADESYYITVNTMFKLAKHARELFDSSEKRAILNYILSNYTINEKTPCITMRSPFKELVSLSNQPIGLPLVDEFRTLNWVQIKRDIEFSKIFEMLPMMALQNS